MSFPAAPASRRKHVEEGRVALGKLFEDVVHVEAGERDLRGPRQVQVVGLERVDVRALGREEPGAVHRLLADEDGRDQRRVAVRGGAVEREPVERHRDECRVAGDVAEARARESCSALHLEAADLGVVRARCAGVADSANLLGVLVGVAVGRRRVGRVRNLLEQRLALVASLFEDDLGPRQLGLRGVQLLLLLEVTACP